MGNDRVISVSAGVHTGGRMVGEWWANGGRMVGEWCAEWWANGVQNGGKNGVQNDVQNGVHIWVKESSLISEIVTHF
jgi:hypothetical protein